MTTAGDAPMSTGSHDTVVRELRELIEALDRRVPCLGAAGEALIAEEASALKRKAIERIRELDAADRA